MLWYQFKFHEHQKKRFKFHVCIPPRIQLPGSFSLHTKRLGSPTLLKIKKTHHYWESEEREPRGHWGDRDSSSSGPWWLLCLSLALEGTRVKKHTALSHGHAHTHSHTIGQNTVRRRGRVSQKMIALVHWGSGFVCIAAGSSSRRRRRRIRRLHAILYPRDIHNSESSSKSVLNLYGARSLLLQKSSFSLGSRGCTTTTT